MITAIIGAILFSIVLIMTVLLICGLPLGEFTMGGQQKVLSKKLRIVAATMLPIQVFAIIIILQMGGLIPLWFSYIATKIICIIYSIYLSVNTFMNLFSGSKKEKYIMTPLSLLTAICFWLTTFL